VPLGSDPEPIPVLRVRGTGYTEMELYPALKRLRQAILEEYGGPHKELDTHSIIHALGVRGAGNP
jgi:hypothetical protein